MGGGGGDNAPPPPRFLHLWYREEAVWGAVCKNISIKSDDRSNDVYIDHMIYVYIKEIYAYIKMLYTYINRYMYTSLDICIDHSMYA